MTVFTTEKEYRNHFGVPQPSGHAMTGQDVVVRDHVNEFAKYFAQQIADVIKPLQRRIAQLEDGVMRYCGVYQRAVFYKRGSAVTHQGSLFVAVTDAQPGELPGTSALCWQLAHKSRDGSNSSEVRLPTKGRHTWAD